MMYFYSRCVVYDIGIHSSKLQCGMQNNLLTMRHSSGCAQISSNCVVGVRFAQIPKSCGTYTHEANAQQYSLQVIWQFICFMSVSVLVVVILLSVSNNAISQCPPDSGKSLNVITY